MPVRSLASLANVGSAALPSALELQELGSSYTSSSLQITHVCLHVTLCLVLCDLTSRIDIGLKRVTGRVEFALF